MPRGDRGRPFRIRGRGGGLARRDGGPPVRARRGARVGEGRRRRDRPPGPGLRRASGPRRVERLLRAFAAKLDLDGNELWRLAPVPGPSFSELTRLAIDGADDVYFGGYTKGETAHDVLTMKVDPAGRVAWAAVYDLMGGTEVPVAICPDGRGASSS